MDQRNGRRYLPNMNPENRVQGPPLSSAYLSQAGRISEINHTTPPPLPPRTNNSAMNRYRYPMMNGYPGMGGYSNLYSPFGPSRYGSSLYSSGLHSPYSSYQMPYGPYGASNNPYSSFLQMAEESTRPAFESIESVVHVFQSISMMLESTYGAVHSSYSAILGVVDQFSKLKDHLAEVFSILTMLKGLHWLCLKVLYLLGLRKTNPSVEKAWRTAQKMSDGYPAQTRSSAWPFFMFLSLVVGAPWLMFKLLSRTTAKKAVDPTMFTSSKGFKHITHAAYDFTSTQPGELSFHAGDKLTLYPPDIENLSTNPKNWVMALNDQNESGLVPINYLVPPKRPTRSQMQQLQPSSLPVNEIPSDASAGYEQNEALSNSQSNENSSNVV